ncbi:MAG: hypothetical protein J5597_04305 [Spirochaetaceae bacterium]|nr:hypothetical protein [Spirochaetaceae bacterium]
MKLRELIEALSLEIVLAGDDSRDLSGCYTGDLLSDVMGNADDGDLLVTIQAHRNTVAVATLKDCPAIIICNGRPVPDDMIKAAESEKIALLRTSENQYKISGKIYNLL